MMGIVPGSAWFGFFFPSKAARAGIVAGFVFTVSANPLFL